MLKRLFPMRWAKIAAWTGAALAWGTTAIAVTSNASAAAPSEEPVIPQAIEPATTTSTSTTAVAPVPEMPERGLVVVRYTPVAPPPPQIVTRTVSVAGSSSSGAGGGGIGGSTPAAAPAASAPAPPVAEPVQSSGS
jgi:hypothetical protein